MMVSELDKINWKIRRLDVDPTCIMNLKEVQLSSDWFYWFSMISFHLIPQFFGIGDARYIPLNLHEVPSTRSHKTHPAAQKKAQDIIPYTVITSP